MASSSFRISAKLLVGIFVVAIGLLFLADNLGYLDSDDYVIYWPVILIAIGFINLLQPGSKVGGLIALLIGAWFLLYNLGVHDLEIGDFWPLFLVGVGALLVWQSIDRRGGVSGQGESSDSSSTVRAFALMSAVQRKIATSDFRGGELTALMGGVELDLTQAQIAGEEVVIDTFAMWGGVEIKVPPEWTVVSKVFPLMGGFEDSTHPSRDSKKRLIVKGMVIMGGVEVKN